MICALAYSQVFAASSAQSSSLTLSSYQSESTGPTLWQRLNDGVLHGVTPLELNMMMGFQALSFDEAKNNENGGSIAAELSYINGIGLFSWGFRGGYMSRMLMGSEEDFGILEHNIYLGPQLDIWVPISSTIAYFYLETAPIVGLRFANGEPFSFSLDSFSYGLEADAGLCIYMGNALPGFTKIGAFAIMLYPDIYWGIMLGFSVPFYI